MITKTTILIAVTALLSGCGQSADSRYDGGYKDGYAEGYNTTLELRATLVQGDWNDKNYKRGYDEGRAQGVSDALKKKSN